MKIITILSVYSKKCKTYDKNPKLPLYLHYFCQSAVHKLHIMTAMQPYVTLCAEK